MKYVRTFLYKYDGDEKVKNWQWFLVLMNSYKGIKAVYIKMEKMPIFNEFQHQIHCTSEICNGIHKPTTYSITRLKENDAIPNMAYCYEEEIVTKGKFYGDQVDGETFVESYCRKPTEQIKNDIPISFENREVNHSCKYKTGSQRAAEYIDRSKKMRDGY